MGDFNSIMAMEDRIEAPVRFSEIQPMRNDMTASKLRKLRLLVDSLSGLKNKDKMVQTECSQELIGF